MMRLWIGLMSFIFSTVVLSVTDVPKSCHMLSNITNNAVLKRDNTMTYLIKNISDQQLWLTHPNEDLGASAGWTSQLDAGRWSAIHLEKNKEAFTLNCIETKPGREQQIPCRGVLIVCGDAKMKAPDDLASSFWAGENLPFDELINHLKGRGFSIPQSHE